MLRLFLALLLASPAAAARHDDCQRFVPQSLGTSALSAVHLSGAKTLSDAQVWDLAGGPPRLPIPADEGTALVARLVQSGLFSAVEPRVRADEDTAALDIALTENPLVTAVRVRGLSEFRTEDVLERLLEVPGAREVERRRREVGDARGRDCPAPLPPRDWLARFEDGEVRPGILWQGLRPSLLRVLRYLRTRGYPLARLDGELTPSGELRIDIDEGRVGSVEVRGVDPAIAGDVAAEIGIRPGDVFSSGELYNAMDRIQRRWPFLKPDKARREKPPPADVRIDDRMRFRSELQYEPGPPPRDDEEDDDAPFHWHDRQERTKSGWYGFDGDTLVIHLHSDRSRANVQGVELMRHTPVTGFAPGLALTLTIFDPADRTHLLLDGAVNINTRRPSRDATGGTYLERLNAQERVDWLAGPRLRIPALDVAELGGQVHTLTDTPDRWRIAPGDSYLYSALVNRADREYYRRSGFAAFATFHFFEELTLGAEYLRDRYAPLAAPPGVWTVWNQDDPRYGSAPVEPGEIGSAVFRLEYHSEKVPLHKVGSMWRNPETSLVEAGKRPIGLRSVNTLEVADPALGGAFKFTKVVSDTYLTLETGRTDRLTLRLRSAGGRDLPLQKQEGLGGWTALRGYDFKEFRGNASALGTLQLEGNHFGAFLDVGAVHEAAGWTDPKPSAGALFRFSPSDSARVEAAWRLDGRSRLMPDIRLLFAVPL